jgi:hypothetical protein
MDDFGTISCESRTVTMTLNWGMGADRMLQEPREYLELMIS